RDVERHECARRLPDSARDAGRVARHEAVAHRIVRVDLPVEQRGVELLQPFSISSLHFEVHHLVGHVRTPPFHSRSRSRGGKRDFTPRRGGGGGRAAGRSGPRGGRPLPPSSPPRARAGPPRPAPPHTPPPPRPPFRRPRRAISASRGPARTFRRRSCPCSSRARPPCRRSCSCRSCARSRACPHQPG